MGESSAERAEWIVWVDATTLLPDPTAHRPFHAFGKASLVLWEEPQSAEAQDETVLAPGACVSPANACSPGSKLDPILLPVVWPSCMILWDPFTSDEVIIEPRGHQHVCAQIEYRSLSLVSGCLLPSGCSALLRVTEES